MDNRIDNLDIKVEELLNYVHSIKEYNWRLVQICCTSYKENFELNYSFANEYRFLNLKFYIEEGVDIPSISCIYEPAFLYENEIQDLFGIKIKHISIDYEGQLYKIAAKKPFSKISQGGAKNE